MTAAVVSPASEVTLETSIAERFRTVAAANPDALALTTASARYTYGEIDRWSDAIAADLVASAAPRDLPVAIVSADNAVIVPAALGAIKAGHYFVMVDASDPDDRIALALRESRAAMALVDVPENCGRAVRSLPSRLIVPLPTEPVAPPQCEPSPFFAVVFTSGTTGIPKAIRVRQHGYAARCVRNAAGTDRGPGTRQGWTAVPGYTRAASGILLALLAGSTLCAFDARRESLDAFASYLVRERITHFGITPSMLRRFFATAPADLDLSSVRVVNVSSDALTPTDVEMFKARFPRPCVLQVGYASTECGFVFRTVIDHDTVLPGPVPMGKKLSHVEVWLLDEDGNEVAAGETGELVVRSRDVIEGYWNDPETTAALFSVDPETGFRTFRTGDLARCDEQGFYYFRGRRDARLKIHGRRVDPLEVERALLASGPIREAAAVARPDANGELHLVAYVVPEPGATIDVRAMRTALRAAQPAWLIPSRIHEIDAIPMTRALKVDRDALAAKPEPPEPADDGAHDDLERQLAAVWSRVIGAPVHVDDDFFDDHGGESVVAAHLTAAVERATGTPMPMSLLLELSTVSKMAEYVRGSASAEKLAVLVQAGGPLEPIFCVTGMDGSVIKFRGLAAALGTSRPFYGLTFHGFDLAAFPTSATTEAACYLEAIRRIQPAGPYYLAGYSGGSLTALEIARMLERMGEKVAFLAVLDAAATPQHPSIWRRIRNRLDILRQSRPGVREVVREVATRPLAVAKRSIRRRMVERGLAFPAPVRAVNQAHRSMRKDFSTIPWAGTVHVFRARNGQGILGTTPDLGWSKLGVSRLEFHDVPGDHHTMLTMHGAALAVPFSAALAAATAPG